MYGFFMKKNFCDGWDNMFSLIVPNLIMLGIVVLFVWIIGLVSSHIAIVMTLIFIMTIVLSVLTFAYGETAAQIAGFKGVHIADYFGALSGVMKDGILFGILTGASVVLISIGVPFYFSQGTLLGIFLGALMLWVAVFELLSLQWFLAIRSLMHNDFRKCLKKCMLIFFDNTGFSVFMAVHNLVLTVFSVLLIGLMPSFTGITLAQINALRLRLYKYDYLESHPDLKTKAERKFIPWDELIEKDKETLGPRTFKSFIFPWKD
jgi:hypothetical protein